MSRQFDVRTSDPSRVSPPNLRYEIITEAHDALGWRGSSHQLSSSLTWVNGRPPCFVVAIIPDIRSLRIVSTLGRRMLAQSSSSTSTLMTRLSHRGGILRICPTQPLNKVCNAVHKYGSLCQRPVNLELACVEACTLTPYSSHGHSALLLCDMTDISGQSSPPHAQRSSVQENMLLE